MGLTAMANLAVKVVDLDGALTSYYDLDDDWGSSFRDSGRHWLRWLRTGAGPLWWSGEEAVDVRPDKVS